jgi:hypothetical protein
VGRAEGCPHLAPRIPGAALPPRFSMASEAVSLRRPGYTRFILRPFLSPGSREPGEEILAIDLGEASSV